MIDRRRFVTCLGLGLSAGALLRSAYATPSTARIEILLDEPVGTISPDLYGYLLENLGTVIYDGVWVGENSKIPNVQGIRRALIEHLRDIKASVIRWPGGNFADYYDWKDGIGPQGSRPRRTNMWWNQMPLDAPDGPQRYDPNEFGTPEFMRLCRMSGGRPYLNANIRSLPPQEFVHWTEYCNSPAGSTSLADQRQADGSAEPYNVRYWGIGNEPWGAGGPLTVEEYATFYKRFTANVPDFGHNLAFIASGGPPPATDHSWVKELLRICKQAVVSVPIAAVSVHYYATFPPEEMRPGQTFDQFFAAHPDALSGISDPVAFDTFEWYDMLAETARMGSIIEGCWDAMKEHDPGRQIKLAVDEWGAFCKPGRELSAVNIHGRAVTLRDALAAAITLDSFHHHADKLLLANFTGLINQEGGLFRAEGDRFVATPIFHVFKLYAAHQGGRALRTLVEGPTIVQEKKGKSISLRGLMGSSSIREHELTLTVVNPHTSESVETSINLRGGEATSGAVAVLTHSDIHAQNSFDDPERVKAEMSNLKVHGSSFSHRFPPASVTRLTLNLRGGRG